MVLKTMCISAQILNIAIFLIINRREHVFAQLDIERCLMGPVCLLVLIRLITITQRYVQIYRIVQCLVMDHLIAHAALVSSRIDLVNVILLVEKQHTMAVMNVPQKLVVKIRLIIVADNFVSATMVHLEMQLKPELVSAVLQV